MAIETERRGSILCTTVLQMLTKRLQKSCLMIMQTNTQTTG